ncbi:MAG: T9SS type A sorting domain-containing protein [Candidatus Eiseniibacteriota bacterium]
MRTPLLSGCLLAVLAAGPSPAVPDRADIDAALAPHLAASATGIVIDRALPISAIDSFDGSPQAPAASAAAWRQMYDEIRRAARSPIGPEVDVLRRRARTAEVPIALLDLAYERVGPDGLIPRRVFAAAALRDHTYRGAAVGFVLEEALIFTDGVVPGLAIDFDDGRGFRGVVPGERVDVRWNRPGSRTVRVRATGGTGETRHASFAFDVRALVTPAPHDTIAVTATVPWLGQFGSGAAYVYLSDANPVLANPVIVVEGFDLDDTMSWDELYAQLNQQNLVETLRADGFDAVVLDFTEATAPIQENAFVVAELIGQVGAMVPPPASHAVVGASMGGLCTRYALAWMEQQQIDPRVRTFISFDVPHAGANIPLGIQHWVSFFSSLSTDAAFLLSRLDTPAARQMLAYHHGQGPSAPAADPLRAAFLADLAAVGDWPSVARRVAVANGSGAAIGQGFAPGAQLISYEYESFLVDIVGNVWAVPDASPTTLIFDGLVDFVLLPADVTTVTVAGTSPFDNAPGGQRGSMAEMDSTAAPYGDIIALWSHHCFVPTVSALGVTTGDLFFDVSAAPDPLSLTPFDAIYWPAANEGHVEITPESAGWFLAEIRGDAVSAPIAGTRAGRGLALRPAYPNPSAGSASIRFDLGERSSVAVTVYDVSGRVARRLLERPLDAGEHTVTWEREDLAAGVYVVRVSAGGESAQRKVVLLR